jgi:hypothetical protein
MMRSFLQRLLAYRQLTRSAQARRFRPVLESLEDRLVPYVLSGYQWANPNVSVSFMPDGTLISGSYPSNLFAVYNATYPQATWQRQVAMALQAWADVSNLNFHFVSDDGSPQSTAGLAQGDPRFGDIRIGGYNMGSGILGLGWSPGSTVTSGDVELNTSSAFVIGSIPDLASVVMHEVGHAIGFNHSLNSPAVMEGGLWGTYPGPYPDDIAGVQAMYGARNPDSFDAAASNNTLGTASALTLSYGGVAFQADISSMTDLDYYKVTAPSGTSGTLTVSVDARNLSLFDPQVSVYSSSGTLLATASASTYGDVATVNLTGLVAGQTYYFEVSGATTDVFGMGAYKLSAQFGGFTPPTIAPDAFEPNNTASSATNLGKVSSLSHTGLTLSSSTDVDYYTFVAASRGTFAVSVTPTQGSGMLSLTVLSAQQTVLASGQSQTGGVTLSLSLASGVQYYVEVSSPSGSLFAYNLSIGAASGGGGTTSTGTSSHGGHKLVALGADGAGDQGDFFFQNAADDPENSHPVAVAQASGSAHSQVSKPEFLPVTTAGVRLPVTSILQNQAGSPGSPAGALRYLGQAATAMVSTPVTVGVIEGSDVVPNLSPPPVYSEPDGGDDALPGDNPTQAEPWAGSTAAAPTTGTMVVDGEAMTGIAADVWQRLCDGSFADGSWTADPAGMQGGGVAAEDSAQASGSFAATALAVVIGAYAAAPRRVSERRKCQGFDM